MDDDNDMLFQQEHFIYVDNMVGIIQADIDKAKYFSFNTRSIIVTLLYLRVIYLQNTVEQIKEAYAGLKFGVTYPYI